MKIERLRKSHKKEILIGGLITICLTSAIAFVGTRAKYKTTERLEHVITGTIKYTPYDFKIMAMYKSEDGTNYTEITDRMPSSGYIINESKSYCTIDNKSHDTEAKLYTNDDGEHVFKNLTKSDKCYLYFDKINGITVDDIIVANNPKSETPNFVNAATTNEGVYSVSDVMYGGTSYYWRGAVTNNYVKFANKCWRIVRINGDKSIRLIYDGATCHANGQSTTDNLAVTSQTYNPSYDRSEYVGYTYSTGSQRTTGGTASNLKSQTDTWYNSNLASYASKIADGKFCNDRNTASGYSWSSQPSSTFYYAGYDRSGAKSATSVTPTLSCPSGDVYTIKAGAITMDEVIMAGGKYGTPNSSYYLYNGQYYWTMSPSYWKEGILASVFLVGSSGHLGYANVHDTISGVRPVINLRSDVTFSGGDGTIDKPYVVN